MTQPLEFDCLDGVVIKLLHLIDEHGEDASPRGMGTKELLNVCFTLTDPRARLVFNEERRWSFPLAVGEFLWHLAGRNDSSSISHFAPRWADFATDGIVLSSCYGFKIFRSVDGKSSQWDTIVDLLRSDPYTRRAVISLYNGEEDLHPGATDVACACTLQFFVRGDELHMTTYMRSNDAIWGLPYDCFVFTMLQELLACQLGYRLGKYIHFAASLHVYERHFSLVKRILGSPHGVDCSPMPPMMRPDSVGSLLRYEAKIREEGPVFDFEGLPAYWQDLLSVLSFHKARRLDDDDLQRRAVERVGEATYRQLLSTNLISTVR